MKECFIKWLNVIRLMLNAVLAACFLTVACTGNYFSGIPAEHRLLFMFIGIYGAIGVIVNFGVLIIMDDTKKYSIGNVFAIALCDLLFGSVIGGILLILKGKNSENNDKAISHEYGKNFIGR